MIQLLRMIGIAALLGIAAAGAVWLSWDAPGAIRRLMEKRRIRKKQKADAEALMQQARRSAGEEPAPGKRAR